MLTDGRTVKGAQGIESRKKGGDGAFVIRRGAAEEAPFGIEGRLGRLPVHRRAGNPVTHHRNEGIGAPLRRRDRLAVIMGIEDDGAVRPWNFQQAVDHRRRATRGPGRGLKAAGLQKVLQPCRGRRQPLRIGRDASEAGQLVQLADDGRFVRGAIAIDLIAQIRSHSGRRQQNRKGGNRQAPGHFAAAITLISTLAPRSSLATWTKARAG